MYSLERPNYKMCCLLSSGLLRPETQHKAGIPFPQRTQEPFLRVWSQAPRQGSRDPRLYISVLARFTEITTSWMGHVSPLVSSNCCQRCQSASGILRFPVLLGRSPDHHSHWPKTCAHSLVLGAARRHCTPESLMDFQFCGCLALCLSPCVGHPVFQCQTLPAKVSCRLSAPRQLSQAGLSWPNLQLIFAESCWWHRVEGIAGKVRGCDVTCLPFLSSPFPHSCSLDVILHCYPVYFSMMKPVGPGVTWSQDLAQDIKAQLSIIDKVW